MANVRYSEEKYNESHLNIISVAQTERSVQKIPAVVEACHLRSIGYNSMSSAGFHECWPFFQPECNLL